VVSTDKIRVNEQKLKHSRLPMNLMKHFYFEGDLALAQVAREVVESPSLDMYKIYLDMALGSQL